MILPNHRRVVHNFGGVQFHKRVAVQPTVKFPRTQDKTCHNFSPMQGLARAGNHTSFNQVHHAIGNKLGMDS